MQTTLAHLQINVRAENLGFYRDLMGMLGWKTIYDDDGMLGIADRNGTSVWYAGYAKDVATDYDGIGMNHLAFGTATQADVDAAAAYLAERGVALLWETPRHRPEFSGSEAHTYYQIMFESPDRIQIEIVYIGPKQT